MGPRELGYIKGYRCVESLARFLTARLDENFFASRSQQILSLALPGS